MKKPFKIIAFILIFVFFAMPITALANNISGNFSYEITSKGEVQITGYIGSSDYVVIPSFINNKPVTEIAARAFQGRSDIKDFSFPKTIKYFGSFAFDGTKWLKEYKNDFVIVNNVLIKYKGNSESSLIVPENVEIVGYRAFEYCKFNYIELPQGLREIYPKSFYSCDSLRSIYIPENVESIHTSAFSACFSLEEIQVSENNKHFSSAGGALLNKSKESLLYCPKGMLGSYTVPNSVNHIAKDAFIDCSNIYSIVLPEGIKIIDEYMFARCYSLAKINIPNSVEEIGYFAFAECKSLSDVSFGSGLKEIDDMAFISCIKLTTITLSDELERVGDYAFGWQIKEQAGNQYHVARLKDITVRVDNSKKDFTSSPLMKYVITNGFNFVIENDFGRQLGDLDGNDKVNIADARVALRASLNLTALSIIQRAAADVNKDGRVTILDARKVLRVALNLESM